MSHFRRDNQKQMEVIVVGLGNQAVKATGSLVGATTALNIANGQLGILSADMDSTVRPAGQFVQAGDTAAQVSKIKLVQGTPKSGAIQTVDPFEASHKAFVQSNVIDARQIRSFTGLVCKTGLNSTKVFSSFSTPLDDALYKIYVTLDSVRNDRDYGDNDEVVHATFETPDYTALGTAQPLDHMLQNILYKLNSQSKVIASASGNMRKGNKNFVALAIDLGGGATGTSTVVGTIALGDQIPVLIENGITSALTVDADILNTLNAMIANSVITATSEIVAIDLTTAGVNDDVDTFAVMGLDYDKALAFDNIEQVKTSVNVELADAFRIEPLFVEENAADAFEGYGKGGTWKIMYDTRNFGTVHDMQNHPHGDFYIIPPDYIDTTKEYSAFIIEHYDVEQTMTTNRQRPFKTVILLECGSDASTTDAATGITEATTATTTVTGLNNVLGAWLTSAQSLNPFPVKGDSVPGTYFV